MPDIVIAATGRKLSCPMGAQLLEVLLDAGEFVASPCGGTGNCGKCRVRITSPISAAPTETECALLSPRELSAGIRLACMTSVREHLELSLAPQPMSHPILARGLLREFERDPELEGYGVAVDIGTTTLVASLVDLSSGEILSDAAALNPQSRYGLDVLSRIAFACRAPGNGDVLQRALVAALNALLDSLCGQAGVDQSAICRTAVAANCTMTHLLLGAPVQTLGKAPYRPAFTQAQVLPAADIGLQLPGQLYCLPQISAFVGGDIVAGAQVCDLAKRTDRVLLMDIGTNGELVLSARGRLTCCSCAAGPALEGMNIRSGMSAAEGAIEDVTLRGSQVQIQVIGGKSAVGICGSGILCAIRALLGAGLLEPSGRFAGPEKLTEEQRGLLCTHADAPAVRLTPQILITQRDVRQVQLAKGALLSGVCALLDEAGLRPEELDEVLIAGQFGAHLSPDLLVDVGILPEAVRHRVRYVGNTARTGACMALTSEKERRQMEALARSVSTVELAQLSGYDRLLARCMRFPSSQQPRP